MKTFIIVYAIIIVITLVISIIEQFYYDRKLPDESLEEINQKIQSYENKLKLETDILRQSEILDLIGSNGKPRDYITENINNTIKQIPKLKGVEWQTDDYWNIKIPDNSLIYCDIPYFGTKQYSTSKNFDYNKFYRWCKEMKKKGHTIFISEYNMPEDFKCIWSKQITNAMHQTNTKKTVEKLYTI